MIYCKIWNDEKPEKVYDCITTEQELNTVVKNCANKHGWSIIRTHCFTQPFELFIESLKNNVIDFR